MNSSKEEIFKVTWNDETKGALSIIAINLNSIQNNLIFFVIDLSQEH